MAPADAAGDPGADHGLSHLEPAASRCDWAQTIVTVGLLKVIHGRWTCLPLAFAFCLRLHTLRAGCIRVRNQLSLVPFFPVTASCLLGQEESVPE